MKKILILAILFLVPAVSFAYDFGSSGAENLRNQREQEYQAMKKDMQNIRELQERQRQYTPSARPSIQRNSGGSINNYNFSNATNQYTGTMVAPLK